MEDWIRIDEVYLQRLVLGFAIFFRTINQSSTVDRRLYKKEKINKREYIFYVFKGINSIFNGKPVFNR